MSTNRSHFTAPITFQNNHHSIKFIPIKKNKKKNHNQNKPLESPKILIKSRGKKERKNSYARRRGAREETWMDYWIWFGLVGRGFRLLIRGFGDGICNILVRSGLARRSWEGVGGPTPLNISVEIRHVATMSRSRRVPSQQESGTPCIQYVPYSKIPTEPKTQLVRSIVKPKDKF